MFLATCPLDAGREVADDGVEPDVDPLVVALLEARERDRHAPVEVSRDRPRLELPEEIEREAPNVGPPVALAADPLRETVGEGGEVEEEMLRLAELRGAPVDARAGLDQIRRIELVPAVVTLVAASLRVSADRARALDVAVGKRAPRRRREGTQRLARHHVTGVVQRPEHVLRDPVVIAGRGAREEVVAQPESAKVVADHLVEAVGKLLRRDPLLVGGDHDRRSVLVGSADHEDIAATQPVVPGEDVGRHAEPGDVADVAGPARVRPGHGDEDLLAFRRTGSGIRCHRRQS